MAKPEKQAENALLSIKASKAEASRAKAASVKLMHSSQKIHRDLGTLLEKTKIRATKGAEELQTAFKAQATKAKLGLDEDVRETDQIRRTAKKEYNRFKRTYRAATNKNEGVETKHRKITELHAEASTLRAEISKNATAARNTTTDIQELHKSAKNKEKNLVDMHDGAVTISKEIKDTYSIVLDTTLAGTLVTRKQELIPRVNLWEWVYISSLASIALALILILTINRPESFLDLITERLVFVTPLVLVAFVASRQYNRERGLHEEYAFKAAMAQPLRGYTILLNDQFHDLPGARDKILDFTIGAMKNIYDRGPLEVRPSRYHFSFGSKLAKMEAIIEEKLAKHAENLKDTLRKEVEGQ